MAPEECEQWQEWLGSQDDVESWNPGGVPFGDDRPVGARHKPLLSSHFRVFPLGVCRELGGLLRWMRSTRSVQTTAIRPFVDGAHARNGVVELPRLSQIAPHSRGGSQRANRPVADGSEREQRVVGQGQIARRPRGGTRALPRTKSGRGRRGTTPRLWRLHLPQNLLDAQARAPGLRSRMRGVTVATPQGRRYPKSVTPARRRAGVRKRPGGISLHRDSRRPDPLLAPTQVHGQPSRAVLSSLQRE